MRYSGTTHITESSNAYPVFGMRIDGNSSFYEAIDRDIAKKILGLDMSNIVTAVMNVINSDYSKYLASSLSNTLTCRVNANSSYTVPTGSVWCDVSGTTNTPYLISSIMYSTGYAGNIYTNATPKLPRVLSLAFKLQFSKSSGSPQSIYVKLAVFINGTSEIEVMAKKLVGVCTNTTETTYTCEIPAVMDMINSSATAINSLTYRTYIIIERGSTLAEQRVTMSSTITYRCYPTL